jgi:L-aminopeptidase/D-esterase-like protein
MGATVGKILGPAGAMKAGIGTVCLELGGGARVGAIVVVNSLGDVIDPADGRILAGARPSKVGPLQVGGRSQFADSMAVLKTLAGRTILRFASRSNTVIGVVATDAALTKAEANLVARMANDGIGRTIRPAHTLLDGDAIFALSTGRKTVDVNIVGAFAAEAVAQAVVRAVLTAESAGGLPAARDLQTLASGGGHVP